MMPWYALLTIFRVLSISLVIIALPFIWIPIYAFLVLVIICIGFWRTKRNRDFITRGLKSAFTTGFLHISKQHEFNFFTIKNYLFCTLPDS